MTTRTYAVLGAGRQGVAAAYDLARFGDAGEVRIFDQRADLAEAAVARLRGLLAAAAGDAAPATATAPAFAAAGLDARDGAAVRQALRGADAVLSAVPYFLNPALARAAIEVRASFCDLGGNTEIVEEELALDRAAREAGVTITPDCGLAPGMSNTFAAHLVDTIARPEVVRMRCGGLAERPQGPLDYMLVFAIEGLTNEYSGEAEVIRGGEVQRIPTLEEREELEVEGLGRLEAFTTSGGTSTLPRTYAGVLREFDYKTIRYPGHLAKIRVLRDLGLLDVAPIDVPAAFGGAAARIAPRALLHATMTPRLSFPGERDLVVLRVSCEGLDDAGQRVVRTLEVLDRKDEATGFSAMERTTGFPAAIICAWLASGRAPKGGVPLERAMPGGAFLDQLKRRGIPLRETVSRSLT